ncbi:MAG: ATP-dependent RecD-like DNA helicase [Anaerolineae bacterium]
MDDQQHSPALETLEGTVERITFYSEEDGYTVLRLAPASSPTLWGSRGEDSLITVVGNLPDVNPGESLELEGTWQTHSRHGRQFRAVNMRRVAPATVEGLRRYLGSGLIKGIGPGIAERIVDHFGLETLDILDTDPDRLLEVDGVGPHRARLIKKAWQEQKHIQQVMLFLQQHRVSTALAVKIYKAYGDDSIERVQQDPYRLARDIFGVGFKTADQIARNLGLAANHPGRLEAGIVYALNQALNDGHMFLPETELAQTAAELLEVDQAEALAAIERAAGGGQVVLETMNDPDDEPMRAVYLPPFYNAERGIASRLHRILETPHSWLPARFDWPDLVDEAARAAGLQLSASQREAVLAALTNKVSILTGGPGTGKTTTLRVLIAALRAAGHSFRLASPTGRAAKRLNEATGQPASTIHRMLGYSPAQGWLHNEENPLPADFIIVDEASMIDAVLANALVRALDPASHLLLVGDVDQLPSVGAGDVLRDLITSGVIPVTRLARIFRQHAGSTIVENAHRINSGHLPIYPDDADDFFLFQIADDPERAAELVVDIVMRRIPTRFGFDPLKDIQVIVPMYRGAAGVVQLNQALQQALNPPGRPAQRLIGGRLYRVGDKVLQTVNNYDKEVFNGDVGRLHALNPHDQSMTVVFDDRFVEYDFSEASELTHAYAISVHRSQGSEYPVVVMPILTQHYMLLQRNLIYTAITRAKRMVVLVGSQRAIAIAVKNDAISRRYTALARRLRGDL